ncbi:hypothetical protein RAS1_42690 [Phycisphaerae bacterium RAS1]|nr:hypothetical protein RAS1_42690 [Phycisphaerae bacterium RAS1]
MGIYTNRGGIDRRLRTNIMIRMSRTTSTIRPAIPYRMVTIHACALPACRPERPCRFLRWCR